MYFYWTLQPATFVPHLTGAATHPQKSIDAHRSVRAVPRNMQSIHTRLKYFKIFFQKLKIYN